jgi:hypothetical protein
VLEKRKKKKKDEKEKCGTICIIPKEPLWNETRPQRKEKHSKNITTQSQKELVYAPHDRAINHSLA